MKTDPNHCLQCTYAANISLSPVRLFTVEQEAAELRLQLTRAEADLKEKEREGGEMLEALARMEEDARELHQRCQQLEQQRTEESQQHRLNLQALDGRLESAGESLEASLQSRLGKFGGH